MDNIKKINEKSEKIKNLLNRREDLRQYLFIRGFLLTDDAQIKAQDFPFYGKWKETKIGLYTVYVHPLTGFSIYEAGEKGFFLFGHAYDPFTMETDEKEILKGIAASYGKDDFQDKIDEITGVYVFGVISGEKVEFITDPSGMQSSYYGTVNGRFYLTSHSQIVGDICGLSMNELAHELLNYKWYYRVMGPYFPADRTQFDEMRLVVPDSYYTYEDSKVRHKRIWPLKDIKQAETKEDYDAVIKEGADILRRNMQLITKKWEHPAISLTGGIDSNTTFASANGVYDKVKAFSYLSAKKETIDVEASEKIAKHFGVDWTLYEIPQSAEELKNYSELAAIMQHNSGYIAPKKGNEGRKRAYLIENLKDCDVEVKSWTSETIRGYWYKHYGRKSMPKLSPKLFRNLYKIFLTNRKLAHKIDKIFERYIREFEFERLPKTYPPADIFYNEVTWGSWGGINISDMKIYSDITVPYNNRRFLDLMFRVPLGKRIEDTHHLDMKKELNKELYDMNIRVVNMKETALRAFLLNMIFMVNSWLP